MRSNTRRRGVAGVATALSLTAMLTLSGCSASYWPDFSEEPAEVVEGETVEKSDLATVPVTEAQIQAIVNRVAIATEAGDAKLNPDALAERFTGDALEQRTANYTIRESVSDYASIPAPITKDLLKYQLVQSTTGWPRTIFVTVASDPVVDEDGNKGDAPSLALMLTQRIPQENFRVSRVVSLRGGIEMPQAAPAEEGTAVLADNLESLVMQPGAVGDAYAEILQGGAEIEGAEMFDLSGDPLLEHYGKAWVTASKEKSDADQKTQSYSVSIEQGEEPIVSLSTGVGGALVATTVIESQIVDSDGSRYKPQAEGAVSALSGLTGQQDRIVRKVAHQLLFFVPSKEDGSKIELLGVTSELVGAGS